MKTPSHVTWEFDFAKVELFDDKIIVNSSIDFKNLEKKYKGQLQKLSNDTRDILKDAFEKNKTRVMAILQPAKHDELESFFANIGSIEGVSGKQETSEERQADVATSKATRPAKAQAAESDAILAVSVEERSEFHMDRAGKATEKQAGGKLAVTNNASQGIWGITLDLDASKNADIKERQFSIDKIDAGDTWTKEYPVSLDKDAMPPVAIKETINTTPDKDNASHVFVYDPNSRGQKTLVRIDIENKDAQALMNLAVDKVLPGVFSDVRIKSTSFGNADVKGATLGWTIKRLERGELATLELEATAYANEVRAYKAGEITASCSIDGGTVVSIKADGGLNASAESAWFMDLTERDNEPDVWDGWLTFENRSAFPVHLGQIKLSLVKTGDEGETIDIQANTDVGPGVEWNSEMFVVKSPDEPHLPKNILGFLSDVQGALIIPRTTHARYYKVSTDELEIPVLAIEGEKSFDTYEVQSLRESTINATVKATVRGLAPVDILNIEDSIPADFKNPDPKDVKVFVKGKQLKPSDYTVTFEPDIESISSERKMIVTVNNVLDKYGEIGDGETIELQYPLVAPSPPRDSTFGTTTAMMIYLKDSDSPIETRFEQSQPIVVVHQRRKTRVGKSVVPGDAKDTYVVLILYKNKADFTKKDVVLNDFVPDSFTLIEIKPDCKTTSQKGGKLLTWTIPEVNANQEIELTYTIHGEGDAYSLKNIEAKAFK